MIPLMRQTHPRRRFRLQNAAGRASRRSAARDTAPRRRSLATSDARPGRPRRCRCSTRRSSRRRSPSRSRRPAPARCLTSAQTTLAPWRSPGAAPKSARSSGCYRFPNARCSWLLLNLCVHPSGRSGDGNVQCHQCRSLCFQSLTGLRPPAALGQTIEMIGLTLILKGLAEASCAPPISIFTNCCISLPRADSSPSPANACSCSMPSRWGCSGRSSSRRSARRRREPCSPGSGTRTDGASPKRCARDSRGTAKTSGEPPARACIRFRVSCARR